MGFERGKHGCLMQTEDAYLQVRPAQTERDILSAQRLRYRVFVEELGGDGPLVDHDARLERDRFDAHCEHLLLIDTRRDAEAMDDVIGVYRLMTQQSAHAAGSFYSEAEYNLAALHGSGRKLLELGRSCLHPDYRGGTGMLQLWQGLAEYVQQTDVEVLFGVASFHGTDVASLAGPLSLLHHRYLAPEPLRVRARNMQPMDLVAEADLDRISALRETPALIKAYLRLGGCVGEGAFVDHAFNTTDVCLVMDTDRLSAAHRAIYTRRGG
jgi:putative hemolysin